MQTETALTLRDNSQDNFRDLLAAPTVVEVLQDAIDRAEHVRLMAEYEASLGEDSE